MVVGKFMPPTIQMSPFECEISQLSRAISCFLRGGGDWGQTRFTTSFPRLGRVGENPGNEVARFTVGDAKMANFV